MSIETFTKHNRMPFAYSDLPDPPSTIEPIIEIGDLVDVAQGMAHPAMLLVSVMSVSDDHGSIWVNIPGNAGCGWTAIGVHRIETIMRGSERWTRNNKGI